MNKPDILVVLTVIVLLGAAVTSATSEPARPAQLMSLENSIR